MSDALPTGAVADDGGRPFILLSNDDGYDAPGLVALHDELLKHARVIVCAPEYNQSATSHSLSLHRVLRLRRVKETGLDPAKEVFAVDGTPADCVYVALHSGTRVLPRRPDLVISGMNHGPNLSVDVFYSGTIAAAREAAIRGISAMAISAETGADRKAAAKLGVTLALAMLRLAPEAARGAGSGEDGASRGKLLNVNIPPGDAWAVRATRLGSRLYTEDVVFRSDPRGREYLWIGGSGVRHDHVPGSDTEAFDAGCASVTPLTLDLFSTDGSALAAEVALAAGPPC